MTISAAQFAPWIRGKNKAAFTVLAELKFAYQTGPGPAEGTIYLSDRRYRTGPTESPANIRYRDVITKAPSIERGIDVARLGGRGYMAVDSLTLNNADGSLDFLLDVIVDGREIAFYIGDQAWSRSDFRQVAVAVVASVGGDDHEVTLQLRDKSYLLDDTIIGDTIASGQNTGKPKPILMGYVQNFDVTPYMLDLTALKYYVNNFAAAVPQYFSGGPTSGPRGVRDAGASLDSGSLFTFTAASMTFNTATDTLTYAGHGLAVNDVIVFVDTLAAGTLPTGLSAHTQYWVIAAGLTANDFRLSLTKGGAAIDLTGGAISSTWAVWRRRFYFDATAGTIELSAVPSGRVTIDHEGVDAGLVLSSGQAAAAFRFIVQNYTKLAASEYDTAAIALIGAGLSVYYGRAVLDRMNVLDLLDEIALTAYSWYGWTAAGVLTTGQLDLPNLSSYASIGAINKHDIIGGLSCQNLPLPWGKITLDASRNVVVQTDGLAGAVTPENRSLWGQPYQVRVSTTDPGTLTYPENWWDYHKSAINSRPIESVVSYWAAASATASAQSVCDELTDQFKPWIRVHRCTVGLDKYALNPGDCITLTYPRYGLSAGVKVRVASVKTRLTDRLVDLVLVRQVTPDYTTTSHA